MDLGSVRVKIEGDSTKLQADLKAAEVAAANAGGKIAQTFNKSAGGMNNTTATIKQVASGITQTGEAAEKAGKKVQSFVGAIPGMGVAAERFINLIPGLGKAILGIFPVLGAIAFAEGIGRIITSVGNAIEESIALKKAMDELKDATKSADSAIASLGKTIDSVNVERLTQSFGKGSGLKAKANQEAMDAQAAVLKSALLYKSIAALEEEFKLNNAVNPAILIPGIGKDIYAQQKAVLDKLRQNAAEAEAEGSAKSIQARKDRDDAERESLNDAVALNAIRIGNNVQANQSLAELARQKVAVAIDSERAMKTATISEGLDAQQRSVDAAALEVQLSKKTRDQLYAIDFAAAQKEISLIQQKARSDERGKTPAEKAQIEARAAGEVAQVRENLYQREVSLQADFIKAQDALGQTYVEQQRAITEEIIKDGVRRADAINAMVKPLIESAPGTVSKLNTIQAQTSGETGAHNLAMQRLQLERDYALSVNHSAASFRNFSAAMADVDSRRDTAIVRGLEAQREQALIQRDDVEVAKLTLDIMEAQNKASEQRYQISTKTQETLKQESLQGQLQKIGGQIPGQLGGALAGGIMSGNPGKGIGQEIRGALQGIGQQILGTVFQAAIQQLVISLGINTLANTVLQALFGVQQASTAGLIASQTANTAALVANTTAVGAQAVTGGVGAAAGIAGSVGSAASGGLLGSVISGAISAAGSLVSAFLIIRAIHGTTAEVRALRRSGGIKPGGDGISGADAEKPAQAGYMSSLAKIFGADAVRVNIVAISPLAFTNGVFGLIGNLFGFADGGRPPLGRPSIVGERGPELFIPDQAGRIIPNGGSGLSFPVASSNGGGITIGSITANGVNNPREFVREVARQLPAYLKSTNPKYSPASR